MEELKMKKFIANATKNVGQKGVTNKVIEFLKHEGNAILETNELSYDQVKRIAAENSFNSKYQKIIKCL
jgi:hypothetical protein